jgi:hypothetical protein
MRHLNWGAAVEEGLTLFRCDGVFFGLAGLGVDAGSGRGVMVLSGSCDGTGMSENENFYNGLLIY